MTRKFLLFLSFLLFFAAFGLHAQDSVTTVILVRHAEKAATSGDDPGLSDSGLARAELLARMLENSGVSAIFTTQFARTRQTAVPVAKKFGLNIQTINADATKVLVDAILSKYFGRTVLVVGHSNTLPEIVEALGGGKATEIDDSDYDNLYVATVVRKGSARLLRLKFSNSNFEQVCQ